MRVDPVAGRLVPDRLRGPAWAVGMVAAALATSVGIALRPGLAAGAVLGAAILVFTLLRPLAVIGVMLAIGALDLSFVTGGFKSLYLSLGGLDMNGIRLIGMVASLGAIMAVDPEVVRHAIGRHGRLYLIFLLYGAATLLYTSSLIDGLRLLFKLAYPFLVFVAVLGVVRTREELGRLVDWILIGAVTLSLINPLYVIAGEYEIDPSGFLRMRGLGGHQNPFSFYLLVMIFISYVRYTIRGQFRYLALCGIFAAWIVATLTRITFGASMAGLVGVALYGALVARNYRAIIGAAIVGAALAIPLAPIVLERSLGFVPSPGELIRMLSDPGQLYRAINWQGREVYWPFVFAAYLSSPLLGLGLGASSALLRVEFAGASDVVHNEYLRLLSETGLIGVALFAAAVLWWWALVIRVGRTPDPLAREFALPAAGGILAWAIISVTDNAFDYYAPFTQYIGFLCAGALAAVSLPSEAPSPSAAPSGAAPAAAMQTAAEPRAAHGVEGSDAEG